MADEYGAPVDYGVIGIDPATGLLVSNEYARPGVTYEQPWAQPVAQTPATQQPVQQPDPFGGMNPQDAMTMMADQGRPGFSDLVGYNPGMDPLADEARERMLRADLGWEWQGGSAPVPEGWMDRTRAGATPDFFGPERDALFTREHGTTADEEAIRLQENEHMRQQAAEREFEAKRQFIEKEQEMAEIESGVRAQRSKLDGLLRQQEAIISKGLNPFAALSFGGKSEGEGRMVAALSMAGAIASGNPNAIDQTGRMIDRIVEDEVRSQMFDVEMAGELANNAYSRLVDELGNKQIAETALRRLLADAQAAELDAVVTQMSDPNTMLWAQQMHNKIDQQKLALDDEFAARAYGQVQQAYQQGRAGSAPGYVRSRQKDWDSHLKNTAGISSQQAGTKKTYGEINQQEAIASGDMKPDFTNQTGTLKELRGIEAALDDVDRLIKKGGGGGVNLENGEIIGRPRDVPGKGPIDSPVSNIPYVKFNRQGREYKKDVESFVDNHILSMAGTTFTEGLANRYAKKVGSHDEEEHLAGIQSVAQQLAARRKSIMQQMDQNQERWLEKRRNDQFGERTPTPGQFGDVTRGR